MHSIITEFHANENWEYNVPFHPQLSLQKLQTHSSHVNKQNSSKLCYGSTNIVIILDS